MKDTDSIDVVCNECHSIFKLKYVSYRKNKTHIHYCKDCRNKHQADWMKDMTDDEYQQYQTKRSISIKNGWNKQSKEKKDEISKIRSDSWTDARRNNASAQMHALWNNMNKDDHDARINKLFDGRNKYWKDKNNILKHSNDARKRWYQQPVEEQERILSALTAGRLNFWNNITKEEYDKILRKQSASMCEYWKSLSENEKENRMKLTRDGLEKYFNRLDVYPNKNEQSFISLLDKYLIKYKFIYYNTIKHPDFDKLFPINPVKNNAIVSPFHAWDFVIYTNKQPILVDIDGSIHDPNNSNNVVTDYNGNKFKLCDYIAFNDSKRPYQTDGLDAYIIQCYDDNLNEQTNVINISTNKSCTLNEFIVLINSLNLMK